MLRDDINGQPHLKDMPMPKDQQAADIAAYLRRISGIEARPRVTLDNYVDALVGYRGTTSYRADCAAGKQSLDLTCTIADLTNPRGMGRAFLNSLGVAIPSTILPIFFAAFAAYAFSWLDFRGRTVMFAALVGMQVVPLQMTLVPISRLYAQIGLNGTFLGVWLFHTGFGLPYAIYLMRNFIGSLPRDLFESAYLDGASHWTAFYQLALPLSVPARRGLALADGGGVHLDGAADDRVLCPAALLCARAVGWLGKRLAKIQIPHVTPLLHNSFTVRRNP
jgi:alpha-glucoside transport system permease protein